MISDLTRTDLHLASLHGHVQEFEGMLVAVLDWGADAVLLVAGFRALLLARDLLLTTIAEVLARRSRASG